MNDIVVLVIQFVVVVGGFLIGKYVMPKYGPQIKDTVTYLSGWASKFIAYAAQYNSGTGSEKMDYVCGELQKIAQKNGIDMSTEQIKAIIQQAYDVMKKENCNL